MWRRLIFLICFVLVVGLVNSALAVSWTNGGGDNMWCNRNNWNPVGVPTSSSLVSITSSPNDTVVVGSGCDAQVMDVDWDLNASQEFVIEAGASLTVKERFMWDGGSETGTLTIAGDLSVLCENQSELARVFRAAKNNTSILNILPGANVYCPGQMRGADIDGYFEVNMSGGDVNVGGFKIGDNGDGNFYMTGGTMICGFFAIRGRGGAVLDVLIDGGAELIIGGGFGAPEEPEAYAKITINDGTISCDEWNAAGYLWVVDINEGYLRIRDSDATTKAQVEQWIADERIIGRGGTAEPSITWDGDDLVVSVAFVHRTAWNPYPEDDAQNVCLGTTLNWTPGVHAATHNIYFGTSLNDVNEGASPVVVGHDTNSWAPGTLELDTYYYWRVDEVNDACAPYLWPGGIWGFRASDGNAFAIFPLDGETKVPVDSNLSWGACSADFYNVYFSMDVVEVNDRRPAAFKGTQAEATFDPCEGGELIHNRVYYWAIDVVKGGEVSAGHTWSFKTEMAIVDPHMRIWYQLDEDSGGIANDSSGYEYHGQVGGGEGWNPYDGRYGGCRAFNDDTVIEVPLEATGSITSEITVACWLKDSHQRDSDNWVFGFGDENYQVRAAVVLDDGANVEWRAGNDTNDVLRWDIGKAGIDPATLEGWQHWVFVKDESPEELSIYFNGERVDTNDTVDSTLNFSRFMPFYIGAVPRIDTHLVGKMDDFRLFDIALTEAQVIPLFRGGDVELAWSPDPFDGRRDVPRDANLSWRPGDYAVSHDVYFGTNWNDVNNADSSWPVGTSVYKGCQDPCEYEPPELLELETTYYWRIDEVNDSNLNSPWKGKVWRFTVANFLLIDDMESYNQTDNWINDTWLDGFGNWSGAEVYVGVEPINPAHIGKQSMMYCYYNDGGLWNDLDYYSEIEVDPSGLPIGSDWTDGDAKILTLFFDGNSTNDANEQMYLGLEDTGGNYAQVNYGYYADEDMNNIKKDEWRQWDIALSDFTDVVLADVNKLYVGFGIRGNPNPGGTPGGSGFVYFDDIRLYLRKCVPWRLKPAADFTDDCKVDLADVGTMGEYWLRTDIVFDEYTDPGTNGLVGWWKLDEGFGDTANDSSVSGTHNGAISGSYSWVSGHDGSAVEFSNGRVLVPDVVELRPETAVSTSAWIYYSKKQDNSNRVVVKGANDKETFLMQVGGGDDFSFYVRDVNDNMFAAGSDVWRDEWIHIAGTFDGDSNTVGCYVNGELANSNEDANFVTEGMTLSQDTNDLAIGNRSDANDRNFEGTIDDVRVYNRALSGAEVAWLASDGTGYVPLRSAPNIYDEEPVGSKAVNFRDLAKLMHSWGEEKLWPE